MKFVSSLRVYCMADRAARGKSGQRSFASEPSDQRVGRFDDVRARARAVNCQRMTRRESFSLIGQVRACVSE